MASNYRNEGKTIQVAGALTNGALVKAGALVGVVLATSASGEESAVAIEGVFQVAKVSGVAWDQGDAVDFDSSAASGAGAFTKGLTGASGDVEKCAVAVEAAASGAELAWVKLTNPGTAT